MVQAVDSLLANLNLLSELHPEQRSAATLLKILLEVGRHQGFSEEVNQLFSQHMFEPLKLQENLYKLWGLEAPLPQKPEQAAFEIFEEKVVFFLRDRVHCYSLGSVQSLHPCLTRMVFGNHSDPAVENFYLVEGTYVAGLPLQPQSADIKDYLIAVVRVTPNKTIAVPIFARELRLGKEAADAAA